MDYEIKSTSEDKVFDLHVKKFFKTLKKFELDEQEWVTKMLPSNQGWGHYKPVFRNPKWEPDEFFKNTHPSRWALSSFLISKHPEKEKILKMAKYWKDLFDYDKPVFITKEKKLDIRFDM